MDIRLSPLAHKIIMLANKYHVMPGQALPDDHIEVLLDSYPELAEVAFDEIYAHRLLEDNGGWFVLTEKGFGYILDHGKNRRKGVVAPQSDRQLSDLWTLLRVSTESTFSPRISFFSISNV